MCHVGQSKRIYVSRVSKVVKTENATCYNVQVTTEVILFLFLFCYPYFFILTFIFDFDFVIISVFI